MSDLRFVAVVLTACLVIHAFTAWTFNDAAKSNLEAQRASLAIMQTWASYREGACPNGAGGLTDE